jgi:phage protein D
MANVDLDKKYQLYVAPTCQILVNSEDLANKYGLTACGLTVEQSLGVQKFSVTFKDERRKWSDSGLFEVGKTAEIHLGYAGKLETVV